MKHRIVLLYLLAFFTLYISAQQVISNKAYQINWQGIQKWQIKDFAKNVISFEGAVYPSENQLPYYAQRFDIDPAFTYKVSIENITYSNLNADETATFPTDLIVSTEPQLNTKVLNTRGNHILEVSIFPFVEKDNKVVKINTFTLSVIKNTGKEKAPAVTRHTYADNSVLASGKFVKIKVANSGVYKLTYEDLNGMGISPANVRIFGYGGGLLEQSFLLPKIDDLPELSIYMEKGNDGIFNAGDYVLFYAQGANKWSYDKAKGMFTHTINSYSTHGYYFVTSDVGNGKKIENQTIEVPENATILPVEEFTDYAVHEEESISLALSGKEFYGEKFSEQTSYNFNFNFPNPVLSNTTKVRLDVASTASAISTFNLSLDGTTKSLSVSKRSDGDNYEKGKSANGTFTYTPTKDAFNFTLTYVKPTSAAIAYLNYLEVNARRYLKMSGSAMQFQNVDYLGLNSYNQYRLSDASSNVQIWDITNPQLVTRVTTENINNKLTFTASGNTLMQYIAIDPTASGAFPKPEIVGAVANQNLHGLAPVDMVILTHPNFVTQAEKLAQAHREIDQLTVSVVTTTQVYNEFSSGTPDATAYRWVMKMLYDRALSSGNTSDIPKYLLLFGRGTYDNRKLLSSSGENLILTYQAENSLIETQSYVTDDYFAFLDDSEGTDVLSNLLDLGVGRFPVTTTEEADNVVNKTISYIKNEKKGIWKNQLCFLADDGDAALHMKQADSIASVLARKYPSYQLNKIYLDSYLQEVSASGETYPLARTHFLDLLRNGLFLLNYTGHAGPAGWTNEQILTVADVKSLTNQQLPLWVGATCDFLQFDIKSVSAGEHVLLNPFGGGIGIFSAARPVYASQNFTINQHVCDNLFKKVNGNHYRIGDVIALAKNNTGSQLNKLSYVYMGDPAVKMNYPTTHTIKTTHINNNIIEGKDTLRAMSVVNIKGFVSDLSGNLAENFNGELHAVVYDKMQRITTMNNHGDGGMSYNDRTNALFSGKAVVKNGEFSFTFMLPKDIKYNYGGGRIDYYAADSVSTYEAQGYFENFTIGGTDTNVVYENEGPEMEIYLNSKEFVSGDQVNESPLFVAKIKDQNGINRVGSGIGHDLLLTIDQDPTQSSIVNDYFSADANSYTEGIVKYKLSDLANGKHTLTFRAWDLLNNSSTKTIEFEVVEGLISNIFSIYNYPNPAKVNTQIIVNHDRPETILYTTVDIIDLSGRNIWSFSQTNADDVSWDLIGNDGIKVKPGIYLYRVSIKTKDSDISSKTNKLLIIE